MKDINFPGPYVFFSSHDYRSKRKANMHFLAREFAKYGQVSFISIGFSIISKFNKDPRLNIADISNKYESSEGVKCYLHKTLLHPVSFKYKTLQNLESEQFEHYAKSVCNQFKNDLMEAKTVIIESGIAVCLLPYIKKINRSVRIIYNASDDLQTIGCAAHLTNTFQKFSPEIDLCRTPSRALEDVLIGPKKLSYIPHGMDAFPDKTQLNSPYQTKYNLVSIGSMLFDRTFFEIAGPQFPEMNFYIIGAGKGADALNIPNVHVLKEMPYKDTLPYILFADVGLAPYKKEVAPYLADSSLKLMQFAAAGIPAVCPRVAARDVFGRFGYEPGDSVTISEAIQKALTLGVAPPAQPLTWSDVAHRLLFSDHL